LKHCEAIAGPVKSSVGEIVVAQVKRGIALRNPSLESYLENVLDITWISAIVDDQGTDTLWAVSDEL
jgi:hypothetical protein